MIPILFRSEFFLQDFTADSVVYITAMIIYVLISFSAVEIYDLSYNYNIFAFLTIYGYIMNKQCDQLPVGFIARLVEHCSGITEVMGLKPPQA